MKQIGFILMAIGIALLIFIFYNSFRDMNQLKTPVPDDNGVKVIFITPTE